jgi:hypothetical protein
VEHQKHTPWSLRFLGMILFNLLPFGDGKELSAHEGSVLYSDHIVGLGRELIVDGVCVLLRLLGSDDDSLI